MKKNKFTMWYLILVMGVMLSGCGNRNDSSNPKENMAESSNSAALPMTSNLENEPEDDFTQETVDLVVRFGDAGEPFTMHLYDNDTSASIARHVGTSDWRPSIYHYDDYDNWEVMQYYDIPSCYEIPSAPEQIAEEFLQAVQENPVLEG